MKPSLLLPLLALLAAMAATTAACKRASDRPAAHADDHAGHDEGEDAHAEGAADASRVHIDPSMLRDLRITVAPVEVRPGGEGMVALGELSVDERAYAEVASPVSARVIALHASPGDPVARGALLAELQSPELGAARARLEAASAQAHAARTAATRRRALAADRIVSERDALQSEAEARSAEAELTAARATLSFLGAGGTSGGRDSSTFALRAPVEGVVIERSLQVGQVTEPSRTLFRVGDLSRLWLTVHAFERDAVRVSPGVEARVSLAALPGQALGARVLLVGAAVEPQSRTIPVRLEVENPTGRLKPGMSATAFIPLGSKDETLLSVPLMALQQLESGWSVFLPTGEEGAFERRAVGRGRTLGNEVEILTGLSAGEQVVVEGAFLLKAEAEKSQGGGDHHAH